MLGGVSVGSEFSLATKMDYLIESNFLIAASNVENPGLVFLRAIKYLWLP